MEVLVGHLVRGEDGMHPLVLQRVLLRGQILEVVEVGDRRGEEVGRGNRDVLQGGDVEVRQSPEVLRGDVLGHRSQDVLRGCGALGPRSLESPLVEEDASSGALAVVHRTRVAVAYCDAGMGVVCLRDHGHDGSPRVILLVAYREGSHDGRMVEAVRGGGRTMVVEGICRLAKEACGEASSMEEMVRCGCPFHVLVDHKCGSCLLWGA